jgi:nucleotide-binding universal stress UspA family protein
VQQKKIVIGYDGSSFSHAALTWALDEANRSATPVELIYADEWPVLAPAPSMVPAPALRPESYVDEVITGTMNRAVAEAKRTHPLVDVSTTTVRAHAVAVLIERSRTARLMVLGVRGRSLVAGLFGSVVSAVTARAHCPVVVVHGDPPADAAVVAGIDDSAIAPAVLAFAAQQATARKVPLRIIHAWPPVTGLWEETPIVTGVVTGSERQPFDEMVTLVRDTYPDLRIDAEALVEHPAAALTTASATAQLLVVGTRGRGALRGLLLGSISQHMLRHAACPIAVIHDPVDGV